MSYVNLKFKLPDEEEEMRQALRAGDLEAALWVFSSELRSIYKYEREGFDNKTVEKIRALFHEKMSEVKGLDLP